METEPRAGDPFGPPCASSDVAFGHRTEWQRGFEYKTTSGLEGEEWDPDQPPPGNDWVLNTYAGDFGRSEVVTWYGKTLRKTHWRRWLG